MLNKLLLTIWISIIYSFVNHRNNRITTKLQKIKYIDHNMNNKTVYDRFEYYSIIGNREKQIECLKEILNKTSTILLLEKNP